MRAVTLTLMSVGLAAMSCQFDERTSDPARGTQLHATNDATEPGETGLPHVAAGPPVATPLASAGEDLAESDGQQTPSDDQAEILYQLRSRHTALADHELVELASTIIQESARHGLEPALVMAVIHVESAGYHLAVSRVGALGLMQIMPPTGEQLAHKLGVEWHGPDSLFDPVVNVKLGTAYLRELKERYDSTPTALAAYNWGPGAIDRRLRRGATVPSRYIEQVMKAYDEHVPPSSERS